MRNGKSRVRNVPDIGKQLRSFEKPATDVLVHGIRKFAETERDGFKRRIKNQDFRSFTRPPLSWKTLYRRRKRGVYTRKTLFVHGTYVNSIRLYEKTGAKGGHDFLVGIHETAMALDPDTHQPTDMHLTGIADINENGSSALNIPARPHWWPYFLEMTKQRVPLLVKSLRRDLVKAWKSRTPTRIRP